MQIRLVENITKSGKKMTVQDNGGTLAVTHKSTVPIYKEDMWLIKDDITNIVAIKNWINEY